MFNRSHQATCSRNVPKKGVQELYSKTHVQETNVDKCFKKELFKNRAASLQWKVVFNEHRTKTCCKNGVYMVPGSFLLRYASKLRPFSRLISRWGDRFGEFAAHEEARKNRIQTGGRTRVETCGWQWIFLPCSPCGGVPVVMFSIWFRMVWFRFCFQVGWLFRLCCSEKTCLCPRILVKNCLQKTCPTHMSKKHVPTETCPRNVVKKCLLEETCPTNHWWERGNWPPNLETTVNLLIWALGAPEFLNHQSLLRNNHADYLILFEPASLGLNEMNRFQYPSPLEKLVGYRL